MCSVLHSKACKSPWMCLKRAGRCSDEECMGHMNNYLQIPYKNFFLLEIQKDIKIIFIIHGCYVNIKIVTTVTGNLMTCNFVAICVIGVERFA